MTLSGGSVARAIVAGGINYQCDANGNRKEVDQKTSGGATTSAACPQVDASAAPASTARPRTNRPPELPATMCATMRDHVQRRGSLLTATYQRFRYAFDWDLQPVTVISAAMQSGPGTVAIAPDGKSISVTPPATAANGTPAQIGRARSMVGETLARRRWRCCQSNVNASPRWATVRGSTPSTDAEWPLRSDEPTFLRLQVNPQ